MNLPLRLRYILTLGRAQVISNGFFLLDGGGCVIACRTEGRSDQLVGIEIDLPKMIGMTIRAHRQHRSPLVEVEDFDIGRGLGNNVGDRRERGLETRDCVERINPKGKLVEIVEVKDHPWFVGVQFHPEYRSTVAQPHPLFISFVDAALAEVNTADATSKATENEKV